MWEKNWIFNVGFGKFRDDVTFIDPLDVNIWFLIGIKLILSSL